MSAMKKSPDYGGDADTLMADGDERRHTNGRSSPASGYSLSSSRHFRQDASIVFIGLRATGTSSLAFLAASILGWGVIDCDRHFEKVTGSTIQQYRIDHGVEQYRQRKLEIVAEVLTEHSQGYVFACGTIITGHKTDFLLEYADDHPIVYVTRERAHIQQYLGLADDGSWQNALKPMHSFFRQRSNFEFFNLDEGQEPSWQSTLTQFLKHKAQDTSRPAYPQVLRKTRTQVSTFLRNICGKGVSVNHQGDFQTLSPPNLELRQQSQVLCVDLSDIDRNEGFLRSLNASYDAVQLNITRPPLDWQSLLAQDTLAWAVALIRRCLDMPIIIHGQLPVDSDGIVTQSVLSDYLSLLHSILRLAPEYLTVDLHANDGLFREIVRAKGSTSIIGCFHATQPQKGFWRSARLVSEYHRAHDLGCDIFSVSSPATNLADNIACHEYLQKVEKLGLSVPIVAFNSGGSGRLSQVLNKYMTPVIPESSSGTTARCCAITADLATSHQLRTIWHALVPAKRIQYYVFGAQVKQSLSPAMHNAGFMACGLPFAYESRESSDFEVLRTLCSDPTFAGASISLPFKSRVLSLAATLSTAARLIGAANTLLVRNISHGNDEQVPQPNLVAENTDWMGTFVCIAKYCTPANHITKTTSALVIGAGGSARAAIYALIRLGVGHIMILNRTYENALKLKEHFESVSEFFEISGRQKSPSTPLFHVLESHSQLWPQGISLPSIVVCSIPTRTNEGNTEFPPELRHDWFGNPTGGIIADLSWNIRASSLGKYLRDGTPRGWVCIDPIEMLFEQGCSQFEIFTNCKAPRRAMLDAFLSQYNRTYVN